MPGLPPYGAPAIAFPADWARSGREGVVVEFEQADGGKWTGNFKPGFGGLDDVRRHPNGRDVLVASSGNLWQVDPMHRSAETLESAVLAVWDVADRLVYDDQGLWFVCLGSTGLIWRTGRISWDGFDAVQVTKNRILGMAWSPIENAWLPFEVDLETGVVVGGSYLDEHRRLSLL